VIFILRAPKVSLDFTARSQRHGGVMIIEID